MSYRDTLEFLLYQWLDVGLLRSRARFSAHDEETYGAVFDLCEKLAADLFAPFNRAVDADEPYFDGHRVILPKCSHDAARAYVECGMLAAAQDADLGGMQLPMVIEMAANGFFSKASIGLGGGAMLTRANASLLMVYGSPLQKTVFAGNQFAGRFFGTMCLSETQAGSSLSDILTRAIPDGEHGDADSLGPRYRLFGKKMWISNGDHELSDNIIHLVLAKIPDSGGKLIAGTKGLSLFIVPKHLVDESGKLTCERNDVALIGINHKLGYRGIPNTVLSFGEGRFPVRGGSGALGYLVGKPGEGLRCMFHMMNEARIGVGMGATMLGFAGFEASLAYARERRQGRPATGNGKDPTQPPVPIIHHADVKRMLLAQKSYCEGALALELYCARLLDDVTTGSADEARTGRALLEVLTPIAKSWPSEWCLEANSLAIQIHGGYGYTRDFPVEQYWRDNRLNMIHEGTHGIQGLDLLGRKVNFDGGAGFALLMERCRATARQAASRAELAAHGQCLIESVDRLQGATRAAQAVTPLEALANATPYLQAFGHVVLAWIWLDIATKVHRRGPHPGAAMLRGKLAACDYFFGYELPRVAAWLQAVETSNATCRLVEESWL